jgi:hypothetical protein
MRLKTGRVLSSLLHVMGSDVPVKTSGNTQAGLTSNTNVNNRNYPVIFDLNRYQTR